MNTDQLIEDVKQWGIEKGIIGPNAKATILTQLEKTQEELIETRDAAVKMFATAGYSSEPMRCELINELQDGIGDCTVTLILAAELAGLDFIECLQAAYDEIKNRKGQMIDGQFVKEVTP
jgi:NTP pyrophosphatase (non-canonical NTP hydrolase)